MGKNVEMMASKWTVYIAQVCCNPNFTSVSIYDCYASVFKMATHVSHFETLAQQSVVARKWGAAN